MERRGKEEKADRLRQDVIERELQKLGICLAVEVKEKVTSTSTLLRQYAQAGEVRDMLLLAEEQSAGRGRKGRSFYSPEGTGLYMSFLLHPKVPCDQVPALTTLAAAAVAKALEKVSGETVQIKWVNDIWIREKKCVGILTEGSGILEEGCFSYVILGIGINVYEPEEGFPMEIRESATAVFQRRERAKQTAPKEVQMRETIAVEVVRQLMEYYRSFPERVYWEEYRRRSFLIGKEVRIIPTEQIMNRVEQILTDQENPRYAKVLGITPDCGLKVQYTDGRVEILSNGEVSVRPR